MTDTHRSVRVLIDRRPTNIRVGERGAPGYYADIVMCVDAARGYVFSAQPVPPEEGDSVVVAVARETRAKIEASVLRGRVTWVARQETIARALAAEFGGPVVVLASGDSFAPWDAAYQAMDRDLAGGGGIIGYLWRGDIAPEEVAELFAEAARYWRLRPWQFIDDSELLEKPSPRASEPPLLISILGGAGITKGLALFDSARHFEDMMEDRGFDGVVYLSFERRGKLPHTVVQEAAEHGWTVASESSFPMLVRVRQGEPAPCSGNDLRRMTAALQAINEVTGAYRESRTRRRKPRA